MTLVSGAGLHKAEPVKKAKVVLGEDWDGPDSAKTKGRRARRRKRSEFVSLNRSPLARKIITFNLIALVILVAGVLYMNPFRDSLVNQRQRDLVIEAELVADVFEALMSVSNKVSMAADGGVVDVLQNLDLADGVEVFVYDAEKALIGETRGLIRTGIMPIAGLEEEHHSTLITDFLNSVWEGVSGLLAPGVQDQPDLDIEEMARSLVADTLAGNTQIKTSHDHNGNTVFSVAAAIVHNGEVVGVIAITSAAGEIDRLVRSEREQVLQMFVIALLVSIGLSLVLASTIANPLSDLAAAAELGREKNKDANKSGPGRISIPDLTGRPDEIGRLSVALRGMVAALYDRIDANEQFAADVAHELKNPLASLRSAASTLRIVKKDEQRNILLDVVEHDVRRLDRLVSDISNASRLDSELVKEEQKNFNLLKTIKNVNDHLAKEAKSKGIDFISDLPSHPIVITGLEQRLAQVFVNLITNAISFCEEGDAIRIWARRRENRVLIVVEDTGLGIPEQALDKIFKRFYSERPEGHFGNNSGLGLAISKQIVEAHDGVIWAENIRPTDADITSEPLGARFVVGLPI
jgi:two-component system sensor histidine kinase ChvG